MIARAVFLAGMFFVLIVVLVPFVTITSGSPDALAERVLSARSPLITSATANGKGLYSLDLFVTLVPGATDEDAREVWCDVLISAGAESALGIVWVYPEDKGRYATWDVPTGWGTSPSTSRRAICAAHRSCGGGRRSSRPGRWCRCPPVADRGGRGGRWASIHSDHRWAATSPVLPVRH